MAVCTSSPRRKILERVLAGHVGEDPQLHLGVVGGDERVAVLGHEAGADLLPCSVRMGMFWRLGLVLERRPVVVAVWLKVVWSRPSSASSSGNASR